MANKSYDVTKYGAYFKVEHGVLYQMPCLAKDNSFEAMLASADFMNDEWTEVTAPQVMGEERALEFIRDINAWFGTDFNLGDFEGR